MFNGYNSVSRANALIEAPALVTLHQYPDGSYSGVASIRKGRRDPDAEERVSESKYARLEQSERAAENRRRATRQASNDLRRKVRYANLRRLLTFTNGAEGDGWASLHDATLHVYEWYITGGWKLLNGSPIAIVAERGGQYRRIHVHAAVRKGFRIEYSQVIASWTAFLTAKGFTPHNSRVHRFHAGDDHGKHSNGFSSAKTCADYMAKYLAKGFEEDDRQLWEKRYRCNGVSVPEPRRLVGFCLGEVPDMMRDSFAGEVTVTWYESPDAEYAGWFIEVGAPSG